MYVKSGKGWYKHFDFMLIDLVCVEVAFMLAYYIRHGQYFLMNVNIYKELVMILIIFHIMIVFFMESYRGVLKRGHIQELKAVIKYNVILFSSLITYMLLRKNTSEYSRFTLLLFLFMDCVLMYLFHELFKWYLRNRNVSIARMQRLLLITSRQYAEKQVKRLLTNEQGVTRLCGVILTDGMNQDIEMIQGIPVVADMENAYEYARVHIVDEILYADRETDVEFLNSFLQMGITVHISIDSFLDIERGEVNRVSDVPVITMSLHSVTERQLFCKRCIDIVASIIGIMCTLIAMILIGPIIFIQSPGPIFFVQERVGKNGRKFHIIKFRSMCMDAEERKQELMEYNDMQGLMFKMADDPRIIPIGKFIRKTSIDELPQFFNILKGDMSLVGTRPPTVDEYEQYQLNHKSRLATKPGLTGMWQVSGRSGIENFEEIVKLDNEYIRNWSLGLDVKIIWKTIGVVLNGRGAE